MSKPNAPVVALATAKLADSCELNGCLRFVRLLYAHDGGPDRVPAVNFSPAPINFRVPFATEAFEHAASKHRPKAGEVPEAPPVGVPVWWSGGASGHVAISAGRGFVLSTDYPAATQVGRVSIKKLTQKWSKRYEGWTEDINRVTVFVTPKVDLGALVDAARSDARQGPGATTPAAEKDVQIVNAALFCEDLLGDRHALDKGFSHRSAHAYRRWQAAKGVDPTGIPDLTSLTRLGKRYGFEVR
jgi:hypothetical protein